MLKLSRTLLLTAALMTGLASAAHAQVLTANTLSTVATDYNFGHNVNPEQAYTQTFTGISSIDTLTLRFIASSNAPTAPLSMATYFSEWSGAAATGLINSGTLTLADRSTWLFDGASSKYYLDASIDVSSFATGLTPASTYGFTIVGPASTQFLLGYASSDAAYTGGSAFTVTGVTGFDDLTGMSTLNKDFSFIADSSAANYSIDAFTPVPEASTIAVLFAGLFVGGLAFKRVRDRRQQAAIAA